ncbi:DUF4010 domain-containing protein [Candidatus Woesearchaeota archaeon]|nr:DUF4010 domain-containing protein [Candidatus Woesearchaeota archaeon]
MYDLIQKFIVSLALGALIGIEREKTQQEQKIRDIAGIRTFMIITLMGTISAYLSSLYTESILIVIIPCFTLFILLGYYLSSTTKKEIGLTTELSAFTAFLIGVLIYVSPKEIPILLTIAVTLLLSFRFHLHYFVRQLKHKEFFDTIKFIIIAFVILPLLPDEYFGPFNAFNPHQIWLMVVFVSGLSYIGYVFMKFKGPKQGIELTGLLGGLVSSTPLVTSMASESKQKSKNINPFIFASILASSTMFLRMIVEVFILNSELIPLLLIPLISMASIGFVWVILLWNNKQDIDVDLELKSPFTLKPALTFGIIFGVIIFITKSAQTYFGSAGLYITSFLSGLADVDAVTISISNFAKQGLSKNIAVTAISLAAVANTLTKIFLAYFFGSKKFFKKTSFILGIMVVVGIMLTIFINLYI